MFLSISPLVVLNIADESHSSGAEGAFCVCRLEFERQQREELEKLELKR